MHLILDNHATHKHPEVRSWLSKHKRFHLHFTPTSSSWLNLVERWFRELTDKALRRGSFNSVPDLIASIQEYLDAHNDDPKPFVWVTTSPCTSSFFWAPSTRPESQAGQALPCIQATCHTTSSTRCCDARVKPSDLARVATPETLDKIITNGVAIPLSDASFPAEIYDDLRQQAIGIPERLHGARTSIRLSMDRGTTNGRAPLFVTTVRWEFTVVPKHQTRRFVCLSNWEEFRDLDQDTVATSAWYIKPGLGVDAGAKDAFELVEFTVDGEPRTIRRTAKQSSQTYSVSLGNEVVNAGGSVAIAYTYRTVTRIEGHLLQLRVDQPTKGLPIEVDYTDTELADLSVLDYIASSRRARVSRSPTSVPDR